LFYNHLEKIQRKSQKALYVNDLGLNKTQRNRFANGARFSEVSLLKIRGTPVKHPEWVGTVGFNSHESLWRRLCPGGKEEQA